MRSYLKTEQNRNKLKSSRPGSGAELGPEAVHREQVKAGLKWEKTTSLKPQPAESGTAQAGWVNGFMELPPEGNIQRCCWIPLKWLALPWYLTGCLVKHPGQHPGQH